MFDHQWAEVAHYMGDRYYPKLQSCVPFTPVTGSRMLTKESPIAGKVRTAMAQGLKAIAGILCIRVVQGFCTGI